MDIAGVIVNGQETLVVDIDRDGIADAMVADMDNNGIITDNEVINISKRQAFAWKDCLWQPHKQPA